MDISEFDYLWTTEKDDWVLVNLEYDYGIIDKRRQMLLHVDSSELKEALVQKMLSEGNKTYKSILDAYDDV